MTKLSLKSLERASSHKRGQNLVAAKGGSVNKAVEPKPPRFYAPDDVKKPVYKKDTNRKTKLRPTVTPGTVLILLAGRFKGKRVVFLKQLESGLLLVTGPYTVNGVPLRRVNQSYTIATSTKIDIKSVKIDASLNDAFFKAADKKAKKEFFEEGAEVAKKELPAEVLKAQKVRRRPGRPRVLRRSEGAFCHPKLTPTRVSTQTRRQWTTRSSPSSRRRRSSRDTSRRASRCPRASTRTRSSSEFAPSCRRSRRCAREHPRSRARRAS